MDGRPFLGKSTNSPETVVHPSSENDGGEGVPGVGMDVMDGRWMDDRFWGIC